jgi:hypothetical protein
MDEGFQEVRLRKGSSDDDHKLEDGVRWALA